MQAMQSSTASGLEVFSGQFVALRHVMRQMNPGGAVMPMVTRQLAASSGEGEAAAMAGVAEGAGLAHDAGNLLGALSLYSDLLALPGVLTEEHREYAAELRMISDRSWAMIDRLVNHSRGQKPKASAEISVVPNVADRCKGLLSRVAGRPVTMTYGVGAFQPVRVPVEAVERILTNLVKNAAEATPWVGVISIDICGVVERGEGDEVRRKVMLTVRDRGCGMDAATVRRLLQGTAVSTAPGRGLGFRVVRELVAISGGCMTIESQQEVGTSISAEWYAVNEQEEMVQKSDIAMTAAGIKTVVQGEAGWMAC
jgi:signal transduction histidine kinase